jgi:hypothetical protein
MAAEVGWDFAAMFPDINENGPVASGSGSGSGSGNNDL